MPSDKRVSIGLRLTPDLHRAVAAAAAADGVSVNAWVSVTVAGVLRQREVARV